MRTIDVDVALREIAALRVTADRPTLHSADWRAGFSQGVNSALVAVEHLLDRMLSEQRADAGED
jgi:hypothetical protein